MIKNSIAILILAHDNETQLIDLINRLKINFDVFVHIDKKSKIEMSDYENVCIFKRYKVYWGSYNQIKATILLLKESYKKVYDRYILISGRDIPIVCNTKILEFFNNNNSEYIEYEKLPRSDWSGNGGFDRLEYYYNNIHSSSSCLFDKLISFMSFGTFCILRKGSIKFGFKRKIDQELYGGANWMNLTHNCLRYIINYLIENKVYIKMFKYTRCADEVFFQSIICNSQFMSSSINDSLRYVDFSTGPEYPRILRIEDYEKIFNSNKLFARKFDENTDNEIIKKIYSYSI